MNEALRNVREQVLPLIQQQDGFEDRTQNKITYDKGKPTAR